MIIKVGIINLKKLLISKLNNKMCKTQFSNIFHNLIIKLNQSQVLNRINHVLQQHLIIQDLSWLLDMIKILKFGRLNKGQLLKMLKGHSFYVLCLVFSKKCNWFASGSYDNTIQCWQEEDNKEWKCTSPEISHTGSVSCVILNKEEDQLISCSGDNTVKVWRVNCQLNQMKLDYTMETKHTSIVYCLSFNEQETALVSCSRDKRIIIWSKGQNTKWEYMHEISMNAYGFRICFFRDNQIAWQQSNLGITHIFELKNRQLIQRQDLNLNLNEEKEDDNKFPSIRNKNRQPIRIYSKVWNKWSIIEIRITNRLQ